MLRYTTDRARPGLVALYNIRSGNGVGQFLQPRSPHGAAVQRSQISAKATDREKFIKLAYPGMVMILLKIPASEMCSV